jgi:GNAT superfamily N-acetyltransferase
MEINIRRAVKEDCVRLLELIQELADYEKAPQEVTVTMEHFVESGFGARPVWWAFVAEADGQVEGFAMYYIRYSTWKGQRMYLEDLIVTEKMRGKGLGKMLFDQLIVEAKEMKFSGIACRYWNGMNRPSTSTKNTKRILIRNGSIAALVSEVRGLKSEV